MLGLEVLCLLEVWLREVVLQEECEYEKLQRYVCKYRKQV